MQMIRLNTNHGNQSMKPFDVGPSPVSSGMAPFGLAALVFFITIHPSATESEKVI